MTTTPQARQALNDALSTVEDLTILTQYGEVTSNFPAAYVAPPTLDFIAFNSRPTSATFSIYVMVASNDYVAENLDDVLESVIDAVWNQVEDAAVDRAVPGIWQMGAAEQPAYVLNCEVPL